MNQTSGKTCPPCHGDCNLGRTCPARTDAFLQCSDCDCSSLLIRACGGCPRSFALTEPGDLAPEREERSVPGTGLVMAICILFGGICLGSALAMAFAGYPK